MTKGFDANRDLSPFANCLLQEGYNFVCRYYNINNPSKNLTYAEANFLSSVGLDIVAVWENGFPTSSSYFSEQKGIYDGTAAYQYASLTILQPKKTPIYFAVDYDASEVEIDGAITAYFTGISKAFKQLGSDYTIGVYGSGLVCRKIKNEGVASHSWLAQSTGWRESRIYKDYNIKQLAEKVECIESGVLTGDPDESPNDNEGSFKVNHLVELINMRNRSLVAAPDASVCESNPVWDTAPAPSKNPLAVMTWANNLEKDKFGCTRKDATGKKKFHGGIDIKASIGTDCYATEDSVVTAIGYGDDLGKYVAIKFTKAGKVYGAAYCHLSKHDILKEKDKIKAGTVVGKTGKSGNVGTDEPHLHFEVHNQEWVAYDNEVERSAHSQNPNGYIP